jgi:4-hydroxybenzoate polyprenyltransferase
VKLIIRFFINSNFWVAFCALGLTASSEILLQTTNYQISQFVFCATIFTYNFQRIIRVKKGKEHVRKNWLNKNRGGVYLLMFFAFAISAYHFLNFKSSTKIAILFAGTLSVLYPFVLRKIPFVKIFVISFVWAISTMLLLVLENNISISQYIIWHLVSRFLFVFAITIPFDIRDLKYDADDLKTIPLFFGFEKAKWIAIVSLFMCMIIATFQQLQNEINLSNFLALILLYFLASVLIKKSDQNNSEMYFSFWVESLSIFSYLFLVILLLIFQIRLLTFTVL